MWKERILQTRPQWWLAFCAAATVVLAAAVATPLLAQDATVTRWSIGGNSLALDPSGLVWTVSSGAMLRLDPASDELTTYTHDFAIGNASGAAVDSDGIVWFTNYGSRISRLDPDTGEITGWPAPGHGRAVALDTLSDDVWFSCGAALCRLDSDTNTIARWALASHPTAIFVNPQGKIWHVRADAMKVGVLDPLTNSLTEWSAPGTQMSTGPQTIFVHSDGMVWFTVWAGSNPSAYGGVLRLDPATNEMTEWSCPPGVGYYPTGVLVDSSGMVWFAEYANVNSCSWSSRHEYIDMLDPEADPPVFTRWNLRMGTYGVRGCFDQILLDAAGAMWLHSEYPAPGYIRRFQP